ncbi:DUF3320 domain-containing protein [Thiohalocapsa marina]|uniref:DUF3320 domain-containing protein n=1 Tax=Thiohalocapsa marina TaxID=424902 RepID=A0A5M8FG38_9GAMM|nr:DUF3320 domain-containing protein [Thiohalocapsa marina]KAA6182736.1 DUF3320 domain-containing protein [Thiohalocapsa marina]
MRATPDQTEDRNRLSGLFQFAEGVLRARDSVLYQMSDTRLGVFAEREIAGLPGVSLNAEDERWLKVERLRESAPQAPAGALAHWLDGPFDDPDATPKFLAFIVQEVTIDEASDLCEAQIVALEDVYDPVPAEASGADQEAAPPRVRVLLRLERLTSIREGLAAWKAVVWDPWAETERPVRATIRLYNSLYKLYNMLHGGAAAKPPELVWGIGLARWRLPERVVDLPLIEQLVDLELQAGGALALRPREVRPSIGIRAFQELHIPGALETQHALQQGFERIEANSDLDITPFDPAVWEPLLDLAAGQLSASGRHVDHQALQAGVAIEPPTAELRLYSTWAIYARPRSENLRCEDLERLRKRVEATDDDASLPGSLRGYIAPAPDPQSLDDDPYGLTGSVLGGSAPSVPNDPVMPEPVVPETGLARKVHFFPLPYNQEQSRIIDLLDQDQVHVVSVTGPPGTGKTHSIANIVGHYMATGKRVLVTARTAEAIAAVRSKLPEELGHLIIASVGSDREATKQLEAAAQRLLDDVVSLDPSQARQERDRLEQEILGIDEEMRACDAALARIAEANLTTFDYQGQAATPMALAERLGAEAVRYGWMTDRPSAPPPPTLSDVVGRLRERLPPLGDDLVYLAATLPAAAALPTAAELLDAHQREHQRRLTPPEDVSDVPAMARDSAEADLHARQLYALLQQLHEALASAADWEQAVLRDAVQAALSGRAPSDVSLAVSQVSAVLHDRTPGELQVEADDAVRERLLEVAERASQGRAPLGLTERLFNRALSTAVASLRLDGAEPVCREDWQRVYDTLAIGQTRAQIAAQWQPHVARGHLPILPEAPEALVRVVRDVERRLTRLQAQAAQIGAQAPVLKQLFPYGLDIEGHLSALQLAPLMRALRANLKEAHQVPEALSRLQQIGTRGEQPLYASIRELAEAIGAEQIQPPDIIAARNAITHEIARVQALAGVLTEVSDDLDALRLAGAPNWVERCLSRPGDPDQRVPEDWRAAWEWAMLRRRVDDIIALGNGNDWRDTQAALVRRRERLFAELIRIRTLLGLKQRMTGSVQSALQRFTSAVRKIGQGTGKSAPRLRKAARQAAAEAAQAAPVWVMPEHKVVEQLPAALGDFDLVILDEASQSDVTALSALARGKKHLIVGDEQQVSPSAVGIPQHKIDYLRAEHLRQLPNRDVIDEKTSIFEIAMQMWPQTHLMLREHFRCVEPIIQFSTRFYNGRLIPIRVPKASERFDPPLVDIFVKGGERRGKQNPHEAEVIVEEIVRLTRDPAHAQRDIGVISLIGNEQAQRIEQLLIQHQQIGPAVMERFGLLCGDSRTMQGQERSIIFLSMVAAPGQAKLQSTREDAQRFNVALSRARDRLYLVRSVSAEDLKDADLKLDVLRHFADPMPEGRRDAGTSILERCESGFERAVCERLLEANYRVRAQVRVGPYRIDLVVEGADDRRLAIELDGDHWHGPEQWAYDMARQSTLERAGWTFWRVFGSQWITDAEYWWQHLLQRLQVMGIEPIGAEAGDELFTEFRVYDISGGGLQGVSTLDEDAPTPAAVATASFNDERTEADTALPVEPEPEPEPEFLERAPVSPLLGVVEDASDLPSADAPMPGAAAETGRALSDAVTAATPNEGHGVVVALRPEDLTAGTASSPGAEPAEASGNAVGIDPARFYAPDYRHHLRSLACQLIDQSGPISFNHLCERIARLHDFKRTGSEIRKTIRQALGNSRLRTHLAGDNAVFWPQQVEPREWIAFRGLGNGSEQRDWNDVPEPEKLGLALSIVDDEHADPELAMRDAVGVGRMGRRLREEFSMLIGRAREIREGRQGQQVTYLHARTDR